MTDTWIDDVLNFWFTELEPAQWFKKDDATDQAIIARFGGIHANHSACEPSAFIDNPRMALAAIILFDQFSRNMFRGSPKSFARDNTALTIARYVVDQGWDQAINTEQRVFVYMPFEHSEDITDQDRSLELISALGNDQQTRYAHAHREVIATFGRFPHRNDILGRNSTPEELDYLSRPGSGF